MKHYQKQTLFAFDNTVVIFPEHYDYNKLFHIHISYIYEKRAIIKLALYHFHIYFSKLI